jgi:hypothetical protein
LQPVLTSDLVILSPECTGTGHVVKESVNSERSDRVLRNLVLYGCCCDVTHMRIRTDAINNLTVGPMYLPGRYCLVRRVKVSSTSRPFCPQRKSPSVLIGVAMPTQQRQFNPFMRKYKYILGL